MLIINQVIRDYVAHHPTMRLYLRKVKVLFKKLEKYEITQIPIGENSHADILERIALIVDYSLRRTIYFEYLTVLSMHEQEP